MKNWKNCQKKLLIIGPDPLISQSSPGQRPTAQNWYSILWSLGTRDLFSYLWLPPLFTALYQVNKLFWPVFSILKTFACKRLHELIVNVSLTNFFKFKYLVHFRLVYGKVYFHPPGQFLAINGRMGYKIRQGKTIQS